MRRKIMAKIAIDAGHGRHTEGKRCLKSLDPNETREWQLIARYVVEHLQKAGHEVKRLDDVTGQTDVPLKTRTNTANNWGADFCVSIHHNAGINGGSGGGVVSIVYLKVGATTKKLQSEIYNNVIAQTGLCGNRAEPLASMNLHMCRETKMSTVLIENGFMDSKTDVPIILTDDFARKCALGIAKGVVAVAGGQIVENPPQSQPQPSTEAKYYVQVGAYSQKENAEKQLEIARSVGFSDAFIKFM